MLWKDRNKLHAETPAIRIATCLPWKHVGRWNGTSSCIWLRSDLVWQEPGMALVAAAVYFLT